MRTPCPGRSAACALAERCAAEPGPSFLQLQPGSRFCEAARMPHRARDTRPAPPNSSLPGLTRQSILFARVFRRVMDTRVKPAYGAEYGAAPCSISASIFKQPSPLVLAARCVRGLPVPRATCARGWSGGRRQDACEAPLRQAANPPRAARQPRAPKARRSASQRSTNHQAVDRSGAPGSASFRSVR